MLKLSDIMCWRTMQSRDPSFMLHIYTTHIMPVLQYALSIWSPYLRRETDELEAIQRSFTKKLSAWTTQMFIRRETTQLISPLTRSAAYGI